MKYHPRVRYGLCQTLLYEQRLQKMHTPYHIDVSDTYPKYDTQTLDLTRLSLLETALQLKSQHCRLESADLVHECFYIFRA